MVATYGFSGDSEKNLGTLIPSDISLRIILLSMIDSIFLMVREIWGYKMDDFYYCITIYYRYLHFRPIFLKPLAI